MRCLLLGLGFAGALSAQSQTLGRYRLEVSHAGFKKYERENITLGISELVRLDTR
jgi:hypothetical protein